MKVAALIVDEKARMVVDHIRYNRVAGEYDAAEIFTEDMPESLTRALPTAKKGVQDWTVVDSDIERRFAQDLEESADVCVFAHLPRSFKIPTPVGDYAPDWAIAFNEGRGEAHLLRRRDERVAQHAEPEGRRVRQDRVRPRAVRAAGEEEVRYDFVSTYDELLDKVMS